MTNDVSIQLHSAFLMDAWNRAGNEAGSLRQTLLDDQSGALNFIRTGSIASVGKNSTSQSYRQYGPGSLTHTQVVEVCNNLIGLYDKLQAMIVQASVDAAVSLAGYDFDQDVFNLLNQVFSQLSGTGPTILPDITSIRLPAAVALPTPPTSW